MASFTVRVELHGATIQHYLELHKRMADASFFRFIAGANETMFGLWHMPSAEYDHSDIATAEQIRDKVMSIATAVKALPPPWVFVSEVKNRAWSTEVMPEHVHSFML